MISIRLFNLRSALYRVRFKVSAKRTLHLTLRYFATSDDRTTKISSSVEAEDFFGILEKDFKNEIKEEQYINYSNEVLSKDQAFAKYVSKNVSDNNNDLEKYISTKFGTIRLDWQNTVASTSPLPPPLSSSVTKKGREMSQSGLERSRNQTDRMDYFSEMYFGNQLNLEEEEEETKRQENRNKVSIDYSTEKTVCENEMNFIDNQYFEGLKMNASNQTNNQEEKLKSPNNSLDVNENNREKNFSVSGLKNSNEDFMKNDNFIESQYFNKNPSNKMANMNDLSSYYSSTNYNNNNNHLKVDFDEANLTDYFKEQQQNDSYFFTDSSNDEDSDYNNSIPNDNSSFEKTNEKQIPFRNNSKFQNAFEASQEIRREMKQKMTATTTTERLVDSKGFRILKDQVNDLSHLTRYEIANHLKSRILYNKNDIIVINKPYGLASHGGPGVKVSIAQALSDFAKKICHSGEIHLIHRLDKETTGVMLLAKTVEMADTLKDMFRKHQVIKSYWVLTKGIPNPKKGCIDIPIAEGSVDGKHRMILKPEYNKEMNFMKKSRVKSHQAITHYEVLNSCNSCALVECKTETGIKHQVRVHLAFGLNTPVLGDHKYSHFTKLAPQRLFPEILKCLHIRQSKVRHVPMHLHATSIVLPEIMNGKNLIFKAPLPHHFTKNMKSLKIKTKFE